MTVEIIRTFEFCYICGTTQQVKPGHINTCGATECFDAFYIDMMAEAYKVETGRKPENFPARFEAAKAKALEARKGRGEEWQQEDN